jgi:hydrogenase maturation protease
MKKIVIIGIGNPLRQDDGIGILLLEKLNERKKDFSKKIEFIDAGTGGMNLLHYFSYFDVVFLLDAVNFKGKVGEVKFFELNNILENKTFLSLSTHETDFIKIIQLSKNLNELPKNFYIIGVQPKDTTYGNKISNEILKKIDDIINYLIIEIENKITNL